jgi:CO/xanthine dehydrogenase Mo-binding subunit
LIPPSLQRNPELDRWIRIGDDGTLIVRTGKVELGQGIKTAIARIAAEELDVSLERVRVFGADTADGPNELYTVGSNSLEESGVAVRQAAAEARAYLLQLAAAELGAPLAALQVDDGNISCLGLERTTSYWQLFAGKRFDCKVTGAARPKSPEQYRLLGRSGPRLGMAELATGRARFVQDLRLPGMVFARVVRPPRPAARLESLDEAPVRALPGVVAVVRDGSFLAVAAEREEQAIAAQLALAKHAHWSERRALGSHESLRAHMLAAQPRSFPVIDGTAVEGELRAIAAPPDAAQTLRATYSRPFLLHGSIGPSAAVAHEVDGQLTIWSHSQGVAILALAIAQALRLPNERLRLIHLEGPGCYGHNGADDAALDAALVARALPGRPVHLQWTRDDEHAWEPCGSAMVIEMQASLDREGRVIDWNHDTRSYTHMYRGIPYGERVSGLVAAWHREAPLLPPTARPALAPHAGIHRNADPLYTFPRRRIAKHFLADPPLRSSSLRGLGAYGNVLALESFMDELAHAAGVDPVEFRLRNLADERAKAVIRAAAERAGWSSESRGAGRGRGIGFARYKNQKTWAAVVVELAVDDASAAIRLEHVVIAADAGQIVDPEGTTNQLEGGVLQSASWTLKEQVTFGAAGVTSRDWQSYPILGFKEVPEIETVLLDRPGQPWLGAGEATQGPTAAAIANAIFDATGLRLRDTPFTAERLREAAAR